MQKMELKPGLLYYPQVFDRAQQCRLLEDIRQIIDTAPLYHPIMPHSGYEMSAQSTNCGTLGWYSDQEKGYRYQKTHPLTQQPWPALPASFLQIWQQFSNHQNLPDCGLINYYNHDAKMGLHLDSDEEDFTAPVLSISLGDQAQFIIGGLTRKDKTQSLKLSSGDLIILGGQMRKVYHGISKLYPHSSTLLPETGRFNITLRKAGR